MDESIDGLAACIEGTLPRVLRRLFTLTINSPSSELTAAQSRLCAYLLADGPCPVTEAAEELCVTVSAATQIADRLEKLGLVQRVAGQQDRRQRLVSLTEHGRAVMSDRRLRRVERVARVLETMPPERRADIASALTTLLEAAAAVPVLDHERSLSEPLP